MYASLTGRLCQSGEKRWAFNYEVNLLILTSWFPVFVFILRQISISFVIFSAYAAKEEKKKHFSAELFQSIHSCDISFGRLISNKDPLTGLINTLQHSVSFFVLF